MSWLLAAWIAASSVRAEPVASASASTLDLMQSFELAKKQSETLQISAEQIAALEQQYRQVFAATLPNLSLNASQTWQEAGGGGGATFSSTSKPQVNFTLTQPIFSGFREYATMRAFKHQGKAAELQLKLANRLLFQNVSDAFYLVVSLEKSLEDTASLRDMTEDRVKELRDRERLGKSRVSEVLAVESQLATVQAQIEGIKGQIGTARELLSFLIGRDASRDILQDKLGEAPPVETEEAVLAKADGRSDVRAAAETQAAQDELVKAAWRAWSPSVGFIGNYYLKRIDVLEPIKWDAGLTLGLPIFSGGSQLAGARLAESQARAARDNAGLVRRQARSQIKTAYMVLQSALAQLKTLRAAYDKARDSYRLVLREYRLGIVDNLNVLQAMNTMQSAELGMDQTAVQIKTNYLRLKTATEELP